MFSILSIDGGGMRGIIPAYLLTYLEQALQYYSQDECVHLCDYFDLIAGTSTGGLLTALYLTPHPSEPHSPLYSAEAALHFYSEYGSTIFQRHVCHDLLSLKGLIGPKYSSRSLEILLEQFFSSTRLSELLKPCLIPAFDAKNHTTVFFNQSDSFKTHKEDFLLRHVVRATTAAPTYFSMARVSSLNHTNYSLVDGGLFANNPTLCAYIEATKLTPPPAPQDIHILSLGTGCNEELFNTKSLATGGLVQWTLPMINILLTSSSETVHHQVKILFDSFSASDHYLRIQPFFSHLGYPNIPLDATDPKSISLFLSLSKRVLEDYKADLDAFAQKLVLEHKK